MNGKIVFYPNIVLLVQSTRMGFYNEQTKYICDFARIMHIKTAETKCRTVLRKFQQICETDDHQIIDKIDFERNLKTLIQGRLYKL